MSPGRVLYGEVAKARFEEVVTTLRHHMDYGAQFQIGAKARGKGGLRHQIDQMGAGSGKGLLGENHMELGALPWSDDTGKLAGVEDGLTESNDGFASFAEGGGVGVAREDRGEAGRTPRSFGESASASRPGKERSSLHRKV